MSLTLIILLIVVGLILLTLEIVALPGMVAGIFGITMTGIGIWRCYVDYGSAAGHWALLSSIAVCIVLMIVFLKSKTWNRFSLEDENDSRVNEVEKTRVHVGSTGNTVSRLAPTGKALIDGELIEVHAVNQFIDPNKEIEVIAIEGYRVDVKETGDTRFIDN